jgi:hypothetical protein
VAWNKWLAKQYPDREKLAAAWGKDLKDSEDPAKGTVAFPANIWASSPRQGDCHAFFAATDREMLGKMKTFLRDECGCKALVTNSNAWTNFVCMQPSRTVYDYVDDHFYVDHPEFIEVDAQGNLKRTGFWESEDAKNMYTTCPNVQGYQDAMVAWVRKIMEVGADGVFVDNLGSRAACDGPKFGKHQHLYEDQNHAFAMLLKRVRELIKSYKPDGAVLGNSASPLGLPMEFWKYLAESNKWWSGKDLPGGKAVIFAALAADRFLTLDLKDGSAAEVRCAPPKDDKTEEKKP